MVNRIEHKTLIVDKVWSAGDRFACGYGIENLRNISYIVADLECKLQSIARPQQLYNKQTDRMDY